jgi:UDP-N-acetylmuramyl tripeptide synthase
MIILFFSKIGQLILKKIGKGSSFPGAFARKCNPNILSFFKRPKILICVTGTTGKTSISSMLCNIYESAGYKVGNNSKGSNLEDGVISAFIENSTLTGNSKKDVLILEVDERYVKKVFAKIKPDYFIVNNISRDQMARNGHFDIVWKEINNSITDDIHLILNADDPLIYKLSLKHKGKISYYGLHKTKNSKKYATNTLDLCYCPVCHKKLNFDYFHYGNLGKYSCPNHDFDRPKVKLESKWIDEKTFSINNEIIKMDNIALYNIYNMSACYVLAYESGVDSKIISKSLNNLNLKIKRLDTIKIGNKKATLLLSKNDTPISYNQSLEYIEKQNDKKTIFFGFNTISIMYSIKDFSWLYDVNFELLKNTNYEQIVCMGVFAYDIAVRLKYAGIDMSKVKILPSTDDMLNTISKETKGHAYLVFPFDMEHKLQALLGGK